MCVPSSRLARQQWVRPDGQHALLHTQVSPANLRGDLGTLNQLALVCGMCVAQVRTCAGQHAQIAL